jgi:hypothetical protein
MLATIATVLILSCKPYHPAPPPPRVTVTCEGSDQVRRNHDGLEISRAVNACTIARCEGSDFVVRTSNGQTLTRVSSAQRCLPPTYYTPVVVSPPPPQHDALRYGLSYR